MTADDLRAIPEACDAAGNRVGWVPVPVATRDALADLIDAAGKIDPLGEHRPFRSIPTQCADCLNTWPCPTENVRAALAALDGPS